MSYSLDSLKGSLTGDHMGSSVGLIKGDIMSVDYSS